jgi:hypothetical protein
MSNAVDSVPDTANRSLQASLSQRDLERSHSAEEEAGRTDKAGKQIAESSVALPAVLSA